jgi:hypothetical protein
VLQKKAWTFDDGSPPALQLQYITSASIDDSLALRREADEVWSAFVAEVEERGFSAAILTATVVTGQTADTTHFATYGFIAKKGSTGTWHLD